MSPPNPSEEPAERRQAGGAARSPRPETAAPGVLERLPRTRPQRPSARRAAARTAKTPKAPPTKQRTAKTPKTAPTPPSAARTPKAAPATPRATKRPKAGPKLTEPPAPPQGFEAEELEPGRPVQPPSGSEVATAVVELLGETAQAGLSAGGRLLRDTLRRLAGS